MIIDGITVPDIFIKVCGEESHAKDVVSGNIYMKKISYYRWLENQYMGDKIDGLGPINGMKILNEEGENLFDTFPNLMPCIGSLLDSTPVFCVALLDERISYAENGVVKLKDEFVEEMLKFGKYFVVFNGNEFVANAHTWCVENGIDYMGSAVEYCDIFEAYSTKDLFYKSIGTPYFKKDLSYKRQNEWRFVLFDKTLIPKDKDFYVMKIGKINTAKILTEDEFRNFTLE